MRNNSKCENNDAVLCCYLLQFNSLQTTWPLTLLLVFDANVVCVLIIDYITN